MTYIKLSHDLCIFVTLQQGQVQVLPCWLGHESREGHERSITSTGLTNQTAAQERNGLCGILEGERERERGSLGVRKGRRDTGVLYPFVKGQTNRVPNTSTRCFPSPSHPPEGYTCYYQSTITLQHQQLTVCNPRHPLATVAMPAKLSIHST